MHCQGGDDPIGGVPWRKAECHMCMNCTDACPHQSLQFKFFRKEREVVGTSLDRRKAITGIAAGALVVPLMRSTPGLAKGRDEHLIRPPGSLDETDFLSRCIRCGECMKVCPNNSLQPTFTEAGVEGMWTPCCVQSLDTASQVVSCARRSVQPARSGRSLRRKRAGSWESEKGRSRFAWERLFMIAAAACHGQWQPTASFARSGVLSRLRRSTSKKRRWSAPMEK